MVRHIAALMLFAGLIVGATSTASHAARPNDTLLPAWTKAYVTIPDANVLVDQFDKCSLGQLLNDPSIQPFREDLRKQLGNREAQFQDAMGLTTKELKDVSRGEMTIAIIKTTDDGKAAMTTLVDVTGNVDAAQKLTQKAGASLVAKHQARASTAKHGDVTLAVYDLPATRFNMPSKTVYFVKDNILCVTQSVSAAGDILNRIAAPANDSLNSVSAYKSVMTRCSSSNPQLPNHLSWFVEPLGLADAIRATEKPRKRRTGQQDMLKLLKEQGLTALEGLGGIACFSAGEYSIVHRMAVHAPAPYKRAMQMIAPINAKEHAPLPWVPSNVSTFTSIQWDIPKSFDNFGYLFDALFGEGETGIWKDVLDSIKNDPDGPHLDVTNELIAYLGPRITIIADNQRPLGEFSQRRLVAAEIKDGAKNEAKVADSLFRALNGDPAVKIVERTIGGKPYKIFELLPQEAEEQETPKVQGGGVQAAPAAAGKKEKPHSALAVAHGELLIATRISLLEEVIANPEAAKKLAQDADYQTVMAELAKLGASVNCAQGFARNGDKIEVTYEMFRLGRLPETDTPLANLLNSIFTEGDEEVRQARLDGTKLPPFESVRRYFGIGGTYVTYDAQGMFAVGFTMTKGARAAEAHKPGTGAAPSTR